MRDSRFAAALAVLLVVSGIGRSVPAVSQTYPGPCGATLQLCLDGLPAGATVEVATAGPIVEDITATKSVTLKPAAGFSPVIQGSLVLSGQAAVTTFSVTGFTVEGRIAAAPGAGDLAVTISDNTVEAGGGTGIEIFSGSAGPFGDVFGTVARNHVSAIGSGAASPCIGIAVTAPNDTGGLFMTVEDNVVTATGCDDGGGILGVATGGSAMNLSLVKNRVNATGSNSGIGVTIDSGATAALTARLSGNFVFGQSDGPGVGGGLWVEAVSSPASVLVTNNTVVGNAHGLRVGVDSTAGGTIITGFVANNIVAFSSVTGLDLVASAPNQHNLVFGNATDFFALGAGTVTSNPQLAAATDFHLLGSSPAINAGLNGALGPELVTDLDGEPRVQEGTVDIGADESLRSTLVDVPALGTWGVLLCGGALAVAAVLTLRGR